MNKLYNKNWDYIPFQERGHVFCDSIKMHSYLWVKPTYKVGEVWEWYGGFGNRVKIIKVFKNGQVLVKEYERLEYESCDDNKINTWVKVKNPLYEVYSTDQWGYASNGTPSLRLRIK